MSSSSSPTLSAHRTVVHKFGGTSVADAARYRHVADLLLARDESLQITVVSAMKGVTDTLINLAQQAAANTQGWQQQCAALRQRHDQAAQELLNTPLDPDFLAWLDERFCRLQEILGALAVIGEAPQDVLDRVQGLGEVLSAHLLGYHLRARGVACEVLDAREVLVVNHGELGVEVDWQTSAEKLATWRQSHPLSRIVATGFIARNGSGRITTLGRNGSDFSGAIFAALFNADELHIWTDVDGVLSADPRTVPEAVQLEALSYDEACELAYFGAKVVHPQTMSPAIERGLPIIIRNTFNPTHPGTRIAKRANQTSESGPVKGLTLSHDMALLNLEGTGLIGVPGTAERVFSALRTAKVSVVMISQGSSEHSICCVVRQKHAQQARAVLLQAFSHELTSGQVQRVQLIEGMSVLAAVGDGMVGHPGVAARLFGALARAQVNIRAIAQGSSERNISVAIDRHDASKALRAAHTGFWLSPQTFAIGVIGPGQVGAAFLEQLRSARPQLLQKNLDLRLRAIASSRRMLLAERSVPEDWKPAFEAASTALDLEKFVEHLLSAHLPHTLIVDCSSSAEVADYYPHWLAAGIHVVTPNKQAGAGPLARWQAIREATFSSGARFRYEATVGAGLPVITTLRDLVDTGDSVSSIAGIFSGTLAWLFNKYDGSVAFSELVHQAQAMGYTEPDPREDLSGMDVARKLVILAREAGYTLSLDDVDIESLVPETLRQSSVEEFMTRLAEVDDAFAQRQQHARKHGKVLRYIGQFTPGQVIRVGLVELDEAHTFANLRLTDNVVQFTTRRYCDNPLVVQGPGAGPEVTAAGVFADVLRVAAGEGARL